MLIDVSTPIFIIEVRLSRSIPLLSTKDTTLSKRIIVEGIPRATFSESRLVMGHGERHKFFQCPCHVRLMVQNGRTENTGGGGGGGDGCHLGKGRGGAEVRGRNVHNGEAVAQLG